MNYYPCAEKCGSDHPWLPGTKPCPNKAKLAALPLLSEEAKAALLRKEPKPVIDPPVKTKPVKTLQVKTKQEKFDRAAYQRAYMKEYMRKLRAKGK